MTVLGSGRTKPVRRIARWLLWERIVSSIPTLKEHGRNAVETYTPGHDFLFSPKTR